MPRIITALLLITTFLGSTASAQDKKKSKPDIYCVVQVTNSGETSFGVELEKNLKSWAKGLSSQYKEALKEWTREKKENKGKASSPKPKKTRFKKLKGGLANKELAETTLGVLRTKWEKAMEKKRKKKTKH